MSCCSKPQFIIDPALIADIGGAVSNLSSVTAPDGTITITHDPGDGSDPVDIVIPPTTEDPCVFVSSATSPDGTAVVVTITDGVAVYTNPDGSPYAGDPGDLS